VRSLVDDLALRPLGLARAAFGIVFLLRTTPLLAPLAPSFLRGTNGWLGWPDGGVHVPILGLAFPGFVVASLVVIRTLAALALAFGLYSRVAGLVAGVAGYLVLAQDAFGYFHHLHMLYLGAILFAIVDADSAVAVRISPAASPRSSLVLMRAFVASVYLWAAIGKLASEWGTGAALTAFAGSGAIRPSVGTWLLEPGRAAVVEIAVVVAELLLAVGLMWPRTRRVAIGLAFGMHGGFEYIGRVDSIGWQMAALLLVFTGSARPAPATR
jgi:hypothetical protein